MDLSLNQIYSVIKLIQDRHLKIQPDITDQMVDIIKGISTPQYKRILALIFNDKDKELKEMLISVGFNTRL